jgi:hypothetical protein
LVTSTASEIDRTPASISRRWIHHGVGAVGSTPVTRRTANRRQISGSSTVTPTDSPSACGTSIAAGSRYGTSNAQASSRDRPRTDRQ